MFCKKKKCLFELRKRNPKAVDYVIDEYGNLLYTVIYSVLGSFNDEGFIEECMNDVLLSIWNNIEKFKGEEDKFKSWICAIARFKAIDFMRKRYKEASFEDVENVTLFSNEDVEEEILVKENRAELIEIINTLGEPDRTIFIKKYFLGYSSEKIAGDLNTTKGNVNTRLCRGRKTLRDRLENDLVGGL